MTFSLRSSAFESEQSIPARFTCEGDDVSPPLAWSGFPAGTKTFALVVDDPDAPDPAAPKTTRVHWVMWDVPATITSLGEGAPSPSGARVGLNDWKRAEYGGPCPPIGRHRYFHKLYALDVTLGDLGSGAGKAQLEAAMRGHVLATATLMGTYQKRK